MYKGLEQDFSTPETTEVTPYVFSLEGLIAWLETKPADGNYSWGCPGTCLFAQWGQEMTGLKLASGYMAAVEGLQRHLGLPRGEEPTSIAICHPHNFGAALQRALSLAALQGKG